MATSFLIVKNNAISTLASGITDVATSLTVASGEGALFPSSFPFHITIEDEILSCTNRSTDVLTVVREQQGTSGVAHGANVAVGLNVTAKSVTDLNTAVNSAEDKIGTGASTPTANKVLRATGTGTSAWAQVDLSTDVTGTLPASNISSGSDDDFLRIDGTSVEGRSAAEVLSDIGAGAAAGSGSIVTVGALNSGSITSGFTSIDVGSGAITTTGTVSTGTVSVAEDGKVDFSNTAPGTSGDATGLIFSFTAGATLAIGDVVYMGTGGKVLLSDADAVTSMPALGICTSTGTDTNPVDVMVQGVMKLTGWSFTAGNDIFVSATAGDVTGTAPSGSGDTVQKVGVATASDAAYFNFNTTEVLLA